MAENSDCPIASPRRDLNHYDRVPNPHTETTDWTIHAHIRAGLRQSVASTRFKLRCIQQVRWKKRETLCQTVHAEDSVIALELQRLSTVSTSVWRACNTC